MNDLPGIVRKHANYNAVFENYSDYGNPLYTGENVFDRCCTRGESRLPLILLYKGVIEPEEFLEAIGASNFYVKR